MTDPKTTGRAKLSRDLQVRIFRRDKWLCAKCGRPVVFPPAMWALAQLAKQKGHPGVAYFDTRWSRTKAPLLDHLAAVLSACLRGSVRLACVWEARRGAWVAVQSPQR